MRKAVLLVLVWYMFTNASEKTDQWVTYFEDERTIHKIKREDYLEFMEFMEMNDPLRKFNEDMDAYVEWETKGKFKKRRGKVVYY